MEERTSGFQITPRKRCGHRIVSGPPGSARQSAGASHTRSSWGSRGLSWGSLRKRVREKGLCGNGMRTMCDFWPDDLTRLTPDRHSLPGSPYQLHLTCERIELSGGIALVAPRANCSVCTSVSAPVEANVAYGGVRLEECEEQDVVRLVRPPV